MKRSEINNALRDLEEMCAKYKCYLPPFCHFTPEEWKTKGHEWDEVRECMLGWDITDFGSGDFEKVGFSLITIRNGNRKMPDKYPKVYAEKLLFLKEGQYACNHFHWYKTEDIINRGGGNVLIRVFNALPDEEVDRVSDVTVHTDGRTYVVPAGTQIRLTPGESIHITQRLYHDFSVEPGTGDVLLGEVSQCNDDNTDNRFNPPVGRFPEIEEDEPPYRLLCNEYPPAPGELRSDEMEELIKVRIEDIRTMLQNDGGDCELVKIEGKTVHLRLRGACVKCRHAQMTLKNCVEAYLRNEVDPEIVVERVEDEDEDN